MLYIYKLTYKSNSPPNSGHYLGMEFYIFFILLWLISFLLIRSWLARFAKHANPVNLPPSPPAWPILGHLYLLGPLLHQSLQVLSKRFGPLIHLRLGSLGPVVVVSSPPFAKEFLKTHELNFASRPRLLGSEYTGEGSSGFTFTPYGPYWKFVKKLCITKLFSPKKLSKFSRIREEEIMWFLRSLLEKSRVGELADIEALITALTNNIICRMAMSTRCSGSMNEAEECRKVVQELIEVAGKLNLVNLLGIFGSFDLFGYGKRLGAAHGRYMVMVERIMKAHEEKISEIGGEDDNEEEDLMDILLKISQDDTAEMKLSRDDIKAFLQVRTNYLLFATTTTSALPLFSFLIHSAAGRMTADIDAITVQNHKISHHRSGTPSLIDQLFHGPPLLLHIHQPKKDTYGIKTI